MRGEPGIDRRDVLRAGVFAAGGSLLPLRVLARDPQTIGPREILIGLDAMSRAADDGRDAFVAGHAAAAVMSAAFLARDAAFAAEVQEPILELLRARLIEGAPLAATARAEPTATARVGAGDPALAARLVGELDAGIDSLRRAGHNVIFTAVALRALRTLPEAATAERVDGLCRMVKSFGSERLAAEPVDDAADFPGLDDEAAFVRFVLEEHLATIERYVRGEVQHGYAGHLLTFGHALLELQRLGHAETAAKGIAAWRQFVQRARRRVDARPRHAAPGPEFAQPLQREYWRERNRQPAGTLVASHWIKYPYSYFALLAELDDEALRARLRARLYYLTAVS